MSYILILAVLAIIQVASKQLVRSELIKVQGRFQDQAHSEGEGEVQSSSTSRSQMTTSDKQATFEEGSRIRGENKINDEGINSGVRLQMKRRLPGKRILSSKSPIRRAASGIGGVGIGAGAGAGKDLNILSLFPEYPEELALKKHRFSTPPSSSFSPSLNFYFSDIPEKEREEKGVNVKGKRGDANIFSDRIGIGTGIEASDSTRTFLGMNNKENSSDSIDLDLRLAIKLPDDIVKFDS